MSERGSSSPAPLLASGLVGRLFGIDPRALATLRVSLALIILADLALRATDFEGLHTDAGVLPGWMVSASSRVTIAPFHLLSGAYGYQAALFAIAAFFALLMLFGCFTRVATLASWLLLVSLHSRGQFLLDFGDPILRMLMFWSMLLPLGACWSIDAWRNPTHPAQARRPVVSVASAGLLIQVASIYFFTACLKNGDDWRVDGTAIEISLNWDWSVRPFGTFLLHEFRWALAPLTFATLALEFVGPLLLFSPVATASVRIVTAAALFLLQAALGISFVLGLMPFTNSVMLFAFLPPIWWDSLSSLPVVARLRGKLGARPGEQPERATPDPPQRGWPRRAVDAFAALCLVYVLAYNVVGLFPGVALPESLSRFGHFLRINQMWAMFSPNAPRNDGWLVIPARLADGSLVNLASTGPELSWKKPRSIASLHESRRWQVFQMQLALRQMGAPDRMHVRTHYAEFLCRRWNAAHPPEQGAVTLEVIFIDERTPDDFSPPVPTPRLLVRHQCGAPYRTSD